MITLLTDLLSLASVLFASIYRFTTIMHWQVEDTTWTLAEACTWCVVESACGVISACLPTLRPVMTKLSSQWGSRNSSRRHQTRTTGQGQSKGEFGTETIGGTAMGAHVTAGGGGGGGHHGSGSGIRSGPRSKHGFAKMDSDTDGHSLDELPLQKHAGGIQVQSDFSVSTTEHHAADEDRGYYRR